MWNELLNLLDMNERLYKAENYINITCVVVCVLAVLFSFATNFWGLDFRDTFYIGCTYVYGEANVFTPLTQGIFKLVHLLIGDYVLSFRILNWLTYFSSCLLFYFFVYTKENISKKTRVLLLALSVFFIPLTDVHVFNGNSLTVLGLIGVFVSMKLYFEGKNSCLWGITAFLTICLLARFPNVIIVPALLVFVPLLCGKSSDYINIMKASALSIMIYLIVNAVVFGGVGAFVNKLTASFIEASGLESANHSVGLLWQEYLHSFKDMMSDVKYLSVIIALPFLSCFVSGKMKRIVFSVLFALALAAFVYYKVQVISDVIGYFLLVFFYALVLILVFVSIVIPLSEKDFRAAGCNLLPLLLSVCAVSGSDTGLILMGGPLTVFAPYIIYKTRSMVINADNNRVLLIVLSLVGLALGSFLYCRDGFMIVGIGVILAVLVLVCVMGNRLTVFSGGQVSCDGKGGVSCCIVIALALCCVLYVYSKTKVSFHDRPMAELTCQHDELLLKGILTNTISRDFVNEVMTEYRSLGTDNVVFYGNISAVFSYISGKGLIPGVNFMQDDTQSNVDAVEKAVRDNPIVFLCPQNPAIGGWTIENYPRLNSMLTGKGYRVEKRNCYAVYFPCSK